MDKKYLGNMNLETYCEELKKQSEFQINDFKLGRVWEEEIDLLFEK